MHPNFEKLSALLAKKQRVLVITGAGISTNSGIVDYRDRNGEWKRVQPVKHQAFMSSHVWRQRYWARSQLGYPAFLKAEPNLGHKALAELDSRGDLLGLITQNVDRLHQKSGQQNVIDLHGRLDQVICTACGAIESRDDIQSWLERYNPNLQEAEFAPAPDGDADIEVSFANVQVPDCAVCNGVLKPHVVFFGDTVPKNYVRQAYRWVDQADALLVAGSSLMVFSSFRFVRKAHELKKPIAAINNGVTRADNLFDIKVSGDCSEILQGLLS